MPEDEEKEAYNSEEDLSEISEKPMEKIEPTEIDKLRNTFLYHSDTDLSHQVSEILTKVEKAQSYDSADKMPEEEEIGKEEILKLENTLRWGKRDSLRDEAFQKLSAADATYRWIRNNVTSEMGNSKVGRRIRSFLGEENKREKASKLTAYLGHELGVSEGTAGLAMGGPEGEGVLAEDLLDHLKEENFPHLKEIGRIASYHPDPDARRLSIATLGGMKKKEYVRPEVTEPLLDVVENYVKGKGFNNNKNAEEAIDFLQKVHFGPLDLEEDEERVKRLAKRFQGLKGKLEEEKVYKIKFNKDMEQKMDKVRKNFEIETGYDIETGEEKEFSFKEKLRSIGHLILRSTVFSS